MADQRFQTLPSARSLIRYLTDRGWVSKRSADGKFTKAFLQGETPAETVELFFSTSDEAKSQRTEVEAALRTISQLYDLRFETAALVVGALPYDLLLSRIPDEYVRNESVELRLANRYIDGMKALLAASATTQLTGQASFKRTRKEALEYAGSCRFGHTYKGSFGFVIESPVGLNDVPNFGAIPEDPPFERKVIERLVRGLTKYRAAVAHEDSSLIAGDPLGFSANMCDEVVGLIEETEVSKVDISVKFSPEWTSEYAELASNGFSVERRYIDLLKEAANTLRREEIPQTETVIGRIIRLEAEGNPADLLEPAPERIIVVSWDSSDYGLIRVQIPLSPEQYLQALEIHKAGALLWASGLLKRKGRSWTLEASTEIGTFQSVSSQF